MDVAIARDFLDCLFGDRVSVLSRTSAVGGAQAAGSGAVDTPWHRAVVVLPPAERSILLDVAEADESQVMAVAETALGGRAIAAFCHARARGWALSDGDIAADVAGAQPSAVVRFAWAS